MPFLQTKRFQASRLIFAVVVSATVPAVLVAQTVGGRGEVFVNSELENYLRFLQSEGTAPLYPWSIRGFSPKEVDRLAPQDSAHPWAERYALVNDTSRGVRWDWIRPEAQLIFNSSFPYGMNDGPVWAGRGLTTALQAGLSLRSGPVSLVLAPTVFRAENAGFDLVPNGMSGHQVFADPRNPEYIDLPQRFGNRAYTRVDPGQSTLRIDLPVVAAGISTANQHWGPASEHPILLGNNAPGFLHAFAGSSAPLNVGIGRIHGRVVWGLLNQSDYSVVGGIAARRFMSGAIGVFVPRGIDGLEIGGARFFHTPWPEEGLSAGNFLKPFEGFLKTRLKRTGIGPDSLSDADNQLASVFARWVLPRSGFEVYGEYGREDHSYDVRDFVAQPDHISAYMLGFRKLWKRSPTQLVTLRGEVLNAEVSHLADVRIQVPWYTHSWTRQGHTQRGQLLGSAAGYGGEGFILASDYYHARGRWTVAWTRTLRQPAGEILQQDGSAPVISGTRGSDVVQSLGAEALFFRGRTELTAGLIGVYDFNRNFRSDAFNLNSVLGVRFGI